MSRGSSDASPHYWSGPSAGPASATLRMVTPTPASTPTSCQASHMCVLQSLYTTSTHCQQWERSTDTFIKVHFAHWREAENETNSTFQS